MKKFILYILPITIYLGACSEKSTLDLSDIVIDSEKAAIVSVSATGIENNYSFSVGISSKETGCNQYANWWEIISEEGDLIYRRILGHSHVNEQPFVRAGGPVDINATQTVIIRAHMNSSGYGSDVFRGSISAGFVKTVLATDFAIELANQAPLPGNCAF